METVPGIVPGKSNPHQNSLRHFGICIYSWVPMNASLLILLTGLSVSIGWGIRGQFGHEYGAALAGALGGMAVALLSGRPDWWRRVHYFALFGAIGWGFGGSMSYMKNLAYAQSSDSPTVLYGFASVFLIGFCWAAPGGAGTAIAAFFDREELTRFFIPLCAVLASWYAQALIQSSFRALGMQPIPHWM